MSYDAISARVLTRAREMEHELLAARAEVEQLRAQLQADDERAWETLGRPEGTYDSTNVQRLCAEVERLRNHIDSAGTGFNVAMGAIRLSLEQADKDRDALRADLREAMELLRWASPDMGYASWDEWGGRANLLLAKHKDADQ